MRIPVLRIALVAVVLSLAGSSVATASIADGVKGEIQCPLSICHNPCINDPWNNPIVCPPMHWPPP